MLDNKLRKACTYLILTNKTLSGQLNYLQASFSRRVSFTLYANKG